MPLTMTYEKEVCAPLAFCDHCQRPIHSAADGNYQWLWTDQPARIYFTHKACCHTFEQAHGGDWGVMPLEVLPTYLAHNLGIDWEAAQLLANYFGRS